MKAYKAQTNVAIVFLTIGLLIFINPFHTSLTPKTKPPLPLSSQGELSPKAKLLQAEKLFIDGGSNALPQTSAAILWSPNRLSDEELSGFHSFIESVMNGDAEMVRGVYVPGILALPVVQQPEQNATYVSPEMGTTTEFRKAAENDVIGLLAHNFLSGALFFGLEKGQEVRIIYGDGTYDRYKISQLNEYQKTNPNGIKSDYIDLISGKRLSTSQVFAKFYRGGKHVTFQTCLESDGMLNWGLLFVTAYPLDNEMFK
jgi:hypothetical protein